MHFLVLLIKGHVVERFLESLYVDLETFQGNSCGGAGAIELFLQLESSLLGEEVL
jgi:hypothetical protein